MMITESERST